MSEYESVSELVNKTGASYNEAKYAYEACGGDMLAAVIMLEKARQIKTEKPDDEREASKNSFGGGAADDYYNVRNAQRAAHREARKAKRALKSACGKRIKVSGNREYFDMPLPAFIIMFALAWNASLPAFIISLVCGVRYTLYGEGADEINIAFDRSRRQTAENGGINKTAQYGQYRGGSQTGNADETVQPGGFVSPPQYRQYRSRMQDGNGADPSNGGMGNAPVQNPQIPMSQGQSVQIPRPVQNRRPMEYAGSNPLDSEDKGFFN